MKLLLLRYPLQIARIALQDVDADEVAGLPRLIELVGDHPIGEQIDGLVFLSLIKLLELKFHGAVVLKLTLHNFRLGC